MLGVELRHHDLHLQERLVLRARLQLPGRDQCAARELPAADRGADEHHVVEGRGARELGVLALGGEQVGGALHQLVEGARQRPAQHGEFLARVGERRVHAAHVGDECRDGGATVAQQLAADQVDRLDAVRALVDRGDARVAVELRDARLLDVAHAAVDLDAERGRFLCRLGAPRLGDRRHQVGARLPGGDLLRVGAVRRPVEAGGRVVADGARGLRQRAHQQQHAPHVRVADDRHPAALAGCAALHALARVRHGLLVGAVREAHALRADAEAHVVHHGEHGGEALVRLADEVAHRTPLAAEREHAGRARVDAELVLDRHRDDVVALAGRAVGIQAVLRHDEQRDALRPLRRIGQAREHEVDDVLGHGVVAPGDVDLRAADQVMVALRFGAGRERGQVGTRLRLGQAHGPGPLAAHELLEVGLLEFLGGVAVHREDRALGELRAQRERHVRRGPHLVAGERNRLRESLAAELRVRGDAGPASLGELPVGSGELLRHLHRLVHHLDALPVAQPVDRREHAGRELRRLVEHGIDGVTVHGGEIWQRPHRRKVGEVLDGESHLPDGGLVIGHGTAPTLGLLLCSNSASSGQPAPCAPAPSGPDGGARGVTIGGSSRRGPS